MSELDLRTCETLCLVCAFVPAFLVPLLPFLLNGAPFIGDAWVHLELAEDVTATDCYSLSSYNERWPLVNLLVAFMTLVGGLSSLQASQVVPLLAGLASVSLYGVCRRLGLPWGASVSAVLFVSFNPLYSYVTFAGAVMKETATYYLTMLMLLVVTLVLKRSSKSWVIPFALLGLGIVLGHHFAGLVICLFLLALTVYVFFDRLRGRKLNVFEAFVMVTVFLGMFVFWNLLNYLAVGPFFPVFNVTDFVLLIASFILLWVSLYRDGGLFSSRIPWFVFAAFPIIILGLRGGGHILAQPVEPITVWEYRNYLVAAVFSLAGLVLGLRERCLKAYAASAVSLVLFAFLWGHTCLGFAFLIKSLHYFGPLLAVGAAFTAAALSRRGGLGKFLVVVVVVFLIYASSAGTILALRGLGVYSRGELEAAQSLPSLSSQVTAYGDTHASYLFPYASGFTVAMLKPLEQLDDTALVIFLKPNLARGFLFDYDWVTTETIAPDEQLSVRSRVYDSTYLQAWL